MKCFLSIPLLILTSLTFVACDQSDQKTSETKADLQQARDRKNPKDAPANDKQKVLVTEPQNTVALPFANQDEPVPSEITEREVATHDPRDFHEALSPYGIWYETAEYGSVWQPSATRDPEWRPYTKGQWVYTDQGWAWLSNEPFGWAVYHYGRWARLENQSWIWVPGTEWAPNWCTWRSNGTYLGWAPLPPETLAYPDHEWDAQVESQYGIAASCFTFIRSHHFARPIISHCLPVRQNISCLDVTTNVTRIRRIKGRVRCEGPTYRQVSQGTNRQLPLCRIVRVRPDSYQSKRSNFRNRVEGERFIVASPKIRSTRPIESRGGQLAIQVTRSQSADPQVIEAYRQRRQREIAGNSPSPAPDPRSSQPSPGRPVTKTRIPRTSIPERSRIKPAGRATPETKADEVADRQKRQAQLTRQEAERRQRRIKDEAGQRQRVIAQEREREDERRRKREVDRRAQKEEEERQQAEAQERQREMAQQQEREEAQRRRREERQRQKAEEVRKEREVAQQKEREEAQRKRREEQQRQRVEEERKAREVAQQKEREEAQQRRREEQQRQKAEEVRKEREAAQQKEREEAQQRRREERQRQKSEEERKEREVAQQKEREDAQRRRREEQQRQKAEEEQKEREAAQQKQREEAQQRRREERQRQKSEEEQKEREEAQRERRENERRERDRKRDK